MTPAIIKSRLLQAQLKELKLIVEEMKATPPANMTELVDVCSEVQDELKTSATVLRAGLVIASDAQSDGDA